MGKFVSRILSQAISAYCKWTNLRHVHFFQKNAQRYPYAKAEPGFTVIGSFETPGSLSKVLRDLVLSLQEANIPCQTYSTSLRRKVPADDLKGVLTPKHEFCAARYSHVIEMFDSPFPAEALGLTRATIVFWEFESGLFEAHPHLLHKQLLIGMSTFNAQYFATLNAAKRRAASLRYPFRQQPVRNETTAATRRRYGLKESDFVVFFNFDYGSSYGRKNPDGAMRAFAEAFRNVPDAKLLFKTQNATHHPDKVQKLTVLANELGIADRFQTIDAFLPGATVYELTNICDIYLSLHRGEGFGLGIAEAMSLGKAVVVTDYSATTEFCHEGNSCPVPCRLVPPPKEAIDHSFLAHVSAWAEPDLVAAARALRKLHDDPAFRLKIGATARNFMAEYFSLKNFRQSALKLLEIEN